MAQYLPIFNGAADETEQASLSEQDQMEFLVAWGKWAGEHESSLRDPGAPLFRKKRVTAGSVEEIEDGRVAYAIVETDSHESAVKIFATHPHLSLMAGNSIDVLECPEAPPNT
ncbi:hypothetical protein [Flaviflexus massiliensis]|uniref:hypothetical protein n=1 Tax=Flaviflexus massiliensis TaxID=1522309 RepID=UPI0006D551B3|nr:hypothetical protein [Flaviflexus massiliensis]